MKIMGYVFDKILYKQDKHWSQTQNSGNENESNEGNGAGKGLLASGIGQSTSSFARIPDKY